MVSKFHRKPIEIIELLLAPLEKTESNYSPTKLYDDYAVSEKMFYWQPQNASQ